STRWPTTYHQHIERLFLCDLFGFPRGARGVELGDNFIERHAALAEVLGIEKNGWHRQHVALFDFVLENGAINSGVPNARVQHTHQVKRLNDIGAVVTRQRIIGFELEVAVEISYLLQ